MGKENNHPKRSFHKYFFSTEIFCYSDYLGKGKRKNSAFEVENESISVNFIYIYIFLYSVTVIAISTAACAKAITNISSLFKDAVK